MTCSYPQRREEEGRDDAQIGWGPYFYIMSGQMQHVGVAQISTRVRPALTQGGDMECGGEAV